MSLFPSLLQYGLSKNARVFLRRFDKLPFIPSGRTPGLRQNVRANPLAFIGASAGLLAVLAMKIALDRGKSPARRP